MTDAAAADPDEELPDPVLQELLDLEAADKLDAESIVARAADPDNPLHARIFYEDDSTAAHQRRLDLARHLVRRFKITLETGSGQVTYRRFTHVRSAGRAMSTERAVVDFRAEVLAAAKRDLETFRLKYKVLGSDTLLGIAREILGE